MTGSTVRHRIKHAATDGLVCCLLALQFVSPSVSAAAAPSSPQTTTRLAAPPVVQKPSVKRISATRVNVRWQTVRRAKIYAVKVSDRPVIRTTNSALAIRSSARQAVRVRAIRDGRVGPWSRAAWIPAPLVTTPGDFRILATTVSTATLSWRAVPGATSYVLEVAGRRHTLAATSARTTAHLGDTATVRAIGPRNASAWAPIRRKLRTSEETAAATASTEDLLAQLGEAQDRRSTAIAAESLATSQAEAAQEAGDYVAAQQYRIDAEIADLMSAIEQRKISIAQILIGQNQSRYGELSDTQHRTLKVSPIENEIDVLQIRRLNGLKEIGQLQSIIVDLRAAGAGWEVLEGYYADIDRVRAAIAELDAQIAEKRAAIAAMAG